MAEVEGTKAVSLVFRIAVLGLSVAAAVVMATASQIVLGGGVSYSKYSALVYFVVANVISAVCSALALYLFVVYKASSSLVSLLDVVTQGLLFSAAAAAFVLRGLAAWSWHADDGADAAGPPWGISVCDVAGAFCWKLSTAAAICACAAVAVSVAVLAKDARGSVCFNYGEGGGSGGSCKHGCHSSH